MNKKVFISMLSLCVAFLVGLYVLKIFFPQEFVMVIENEQFIKIGNFIDTHKWLFYICGAITSFATYFLYCCACSHRKYLKWYEYLEILAVVVSCRLLNFYDTNIATVLSVTSFMFLPALLKGDIKTSAIVYTIHGISQGLSLSIRNLPIYITSRNFVTLFAFGFESYIWLALMYIIFNYKKQEV